MILANVIRTLERTGGGFSLLADVVSSSATQQAEGGVIAEEFGRLLRESCNHREKLQSYNMAYRKGNLTVKWNLKAMREIIKASNYWQSCFQEGICF